MKIAWVTPFNTRSAIAKVSAAVTAELVERGHRVTIVTSEFDPRGMQRIKTSLPVLNWRDRDPEHVAAEHDVVIVNVGDSYEFHAGVVEYVDRARCIGILHDFFIFHLFRDWLAWNGFDDQVRSREIDLIHGAGSAEATRALFVPGVDLAEIARTLPMTEWMAKRCGAALAHARYYLPVLQAACPGPVDIASLPQEPRSVPALTDRTGEVVITTVGWINPNKCADVVIAAIAGSPTLNASCRFRIVGPIADGERARLESLAAAAGMRAFDIVGEVEEQTLDAELARSDILCCLRKPTLEGASASAIEAMMAGRPTIVADAGFYHELPDEYVIKVPGDVPVDAVRAALERLAADADLRQRVGAGASRWARGTFTRQRYAESIERLAETFAGIRPHLDLARNYGRDLKALGVRAESAAATRIADTLQGLFEPGER